MKKIILPVLIVAIAIGIFWGLVNTRPEAVQAKKEEKKWLVNAVAAKFETIAPEVTLYGRVETPRDAALKSALAADVDEVLVLEGTQVSAGQLLLRLDKTDQQLILDQRLADKAEIEAQIDSELRRFQRDKGLLTHQKALLDLTERAVERASRLEQSKLASQANLDEARANHEQQLLTLLQLQHDIDEHPARLAQLKAKRSRAEALAEQARVDLGRSEIRAPFAGRIATLNVAEGDRVRAGDALISVYDLAHLEVRAQIPGRYVNEVKRQLDQNKTLTASANIDGDKLQLQLVRLSGEVRMDSGGIDGLFALEPGREAVALGTFVELQLKLTPHHQVMVLPFPALYGLDNVYKIEDGYLKSVHIKRIGEVMRDGESWLLAQSDAIKAGDQIIATQLPNAITGLRVEVSGD